jgi:putative oxidoreductase
MLTNPLLHWLEKLYGILIKIGSNLQSLFLLYMRLTWGHQLFLTGMDQLKEIGAFAALLAKFHYPAPSFHAHEIAILELVGGFLLFIGFFSRLIAIPLILLFLTTLSTIHADALASFRFVAEPMTLVLQRPYPFLITSLLVFIFGPGRLSFDAWIKRWLSKQPRY